MSTEYRQRTGRAANLSDLACLIPRCDPRTPPHHESLELSCTARLSFPAPFVASPLKRSIRSQPITKGMSLAGWFYYPFHVSFPPERLALCIPINPKGFSGLRKSEGIFFSNLGGTPPSLVYPPLDCYPVHTFSVSRGKFRDIHWWETASLRVASSYSEIR